MTDTVRYGLLPFAARLMLLAEFAIAANGKVTGWSGEAAYMAAHGMRFVTPLLAAALAVEVIGTLALLVGWQARAAASLLCVYLAIVTVRLHDFWNLQGMAAAANQTEFFKNLGMMGGLIMIAAYGAGHWALDHRGVTGSRHYVFDRLERWVL